MTIDPGTSIGAVHLTVRDRARCVTFYRDRLGFQLHGDENDRARLGAGGIDLLVLHESPTAARPGRATGLYHFAILVSSRAGLARSLARLITTRTQISGASDHLVSEALYLSDPEGNGIEIYRDRPRSEWPYSEGKVRMASDPIDLSELLAEPGGDEAPEAGLAPDTRIGHVHLRVSDIDEARGFYVDTLGFEETARYGAALFMAAGGYHHHIGVNTWESRGAPSPPEGATGLRYFVVRVPDAAELERVASRVRDLGAVVEENSEGILARDPSGNRMLLAV